MRLSTFHKSEVSLFKHQEEAVEHLVNCRISLLSLPMGLGKTLVSLSMFAYILEKYPESKCLFLTKKSVIQQVSAEVDKFFNDISYLVVYENSLKDREDIYKKFVTDPKFNILVMNYEALRIDQSLILPMLKDLRFFVVLDEATVAKNTSSLTFKAVCNVCSNASRVTALTGTPIMNRLSDIYNILYSMGFRKFNRNTFSNDYCMWGKQEIWRKLKGMSRATKVKIPIIVGYKNVSDFYDKIKDILFSKKKSEVSDIPPFQLRKYSLDMDKNVKQAMVYNYKKYEGKPVYGLLQISTSSPGVFNNDTKQSCEKIDCVMDILDEIDVSEKVVIYSPFKIPLQYLSSKLQYKAEEICQIYGDTKDRQGEIDKFSKTGKVMLITDAGGMGISLQMANHIIFLNLPIQAGNYLQVGGRISRINTTFSNLNLHIPMVKGTIDEDVWRILQSQLILMEKISPDSIDEGMKDPFFIASEINSNNEVDHWIKEKILNRAKKFI